MRISYNATSKTYTFLDITEIELQIFNRAFEYFRPFSDVPELDMYSRVIQRMLGDAADDLIERYL
jgi:hypothetical protein